MIVLAAAASSSVLRARNAHCTDNNGKDCAREASSNVHQWFLKDAPLPGEKKLLQWWQRRSVVADGAGLHIGDVALRTVEYLAQMEVPAGVKHNAKGDKSVWRGRKVLELRCGCGYITVALSRWGASIIASDLNLEALALTQANVKLNASHGSQVQLCRFDCEDRESFAQLRERFGCFDAIIVFDAISTAPTLGGTWQHIGEDKSVAVVPSEMIDATRGLASSTSEIIFVVVDRIGDVKATAQAILERRRWLELVCQPHTLQLTSETGHDIVVFRIRWRNEIGPGGQVASSLWPYLNRP